MPNISIDGPRIADLAKKRELVRTVTDAAVKAFGLPRQTIVILLKENPPENVAIGGELLVDRTPEGRRGS
ncbi:MAG TPA: 4-oxalocrotonate tautomerase DmpI [Candidatus Baltobacteraceae bacterium]|nr:4-oxalocrotonate tautomerase DmpI [Candidatus Baltobacteraceae bacterium]